jgi:hypothetical protein
MKKAIFLTAFCFSTITLIAQSSKFEFGLTGGVNNSKIKQYEWQRTDIPLETPQWLSGSQLNLVFRYRLSSKWAVGTNLQLVQKGWKGKLDKSTSVDFIGMTSQQIQYYYVAYYTRLSTVIPNRLSYFSIPVLAEYRFLNNRMYVQAGGYWGKLIASPWHPLEKKEDWGMCFGIGFHQPITDHLLLNLDANYSHGFSDIYNTIGDTYRLPELAKGNRTLAVNFGFIFRN